MTINIIVAMNNTYTIGDKGRLMHLIGKDMQHFRKTTEGHTVIMGHKTHMEIAKPLPKRHNIVLSRDEELEIKGVEVSNSFKEVLARYKDSDDTAFVIGGEQLIRQALPHTDKVYLTHIDSNAYGDVMMPFDYIDRNFKLTSEEAHHADGYDFKFKEYKRKGSYNE